ncbi:kinase-like domain-containing protein [Penicillium alfredii]|uniref:Kinase-like domain-containing protein n=1 Tax=Penicillium alfredii TaxID=1506179 RepID=A0A9W9FQR5_9EURO|nr:kinase-like domain-containing protein [Penicillium alfredii]KAJ5104569.1 kinase-like domain-containing protein [Penicillium alfredii]
MFILSECFPRSCSAFAQPFSFTAPLFNFNSTPFLSSDNKHNTTPQHSADGWFSHDEQPEPSTGPSKFIYGEKGQNILSIDNPLTASASNTLYTGSVYNKTNKKTTHPVVVKHSPYKEMIEGFKLLENVHSPYVVKSIGYFKVSASKTRSGQDEYFLIMPYLDQTLDEYMYCAGDIKSLYLVFEQLLDAIVAMHSHGIAHHDINPRNAMVQNEEAKWIDFDHATKIQKSSNRHNCMGFAAQDYIDAPPLKTPYSPHKADIFSMGMMLVYTLILQNESATLDVWENTQNCNTRQEVADVLGCLEGFWNTSEEMIKLLSQVLCKDARSRLSARVFLSRFQATPEYRQIVGSD